MISMKSFKDGVGTGKDELFSNQSIILCQNLAKLNLPVRIEKDRPQAGHLVFY
jgi:hypothetical protein